MVIPETVTVFEQGAIGGAGGLLSLTVPFIGGGTEGSDYLMYLFGTTKEEAENADGVTEPNWKNASNVPAALASVTVTGEIDEIGNFAFGLITSLKELNYPASSTISTRSAARSSRSPCSARRRS